jgi:hypothetical protein
MLHLHRGEIDDAVSLLQQTRALARRDGDHLVEFQVLEHLFQCHFQRRDYAAAAAVAADVGEIAAKLREGSEQPFATALSALVRYAGGDGDGEAEIDAALEALRRVDAKYRLGFVLIRAAGIDLERGVWRRAADRAGAALALAALLNRASDNVLALAVRARALAALGAREPLRRDIAALRRMPLRPLSAEARLAGEAVLAEHERPRRPPS